MKIGEEIRRRRKANKWTLEELAIKAGTDTGNLSRLERDVQGYSDAMLQNIADALECTIAELFSGGHRAEQQVTQYTLSSYDEVPAFTMAELRAAEEIDLSLATKKSKVRGAGKATPTTIEVTIDDDSMSPLLDAGDIALVDLGRRPRPGANRYIMARIKGDVVIRQYIEREINADGYAVFDLEALNRYYPILKSDVTDIKVIGVISQVIKNLKS